MENIEKNLHEIRTIKWELMEQINLPDNLDYKPHCRYPDEFTKENLNEITNLVHQIRASNKRINELYQKRINELEIEVKELEEEKKKEKARKEKEEKNKNECKTIHELYNQITHFQQKDIFQKIMRDSEYAKIYLSKFESNPANISYNIHGIITVFGTFNIKKQEREEYYIKIYRQSEPKTFWCSCLDHKFNSTKNGTVCKHICFVVCKILKFLNKEFFDTKKLPQEQINKLVNKLTTNIGEIDKSLIKQYTKITLDTFKQYIKELEHDDSCPICFDSFETKTKVACPSCHNYIHSECIEVILENRDSCIWCMDTVWSKYKKLLREPYNQMIQIV